MKTTIFHSFDYPFRTNTITYILFRKFAGLGGDQDMLKNTLELIWQPNEVV